MLGSGKVKVRAQQRNVQEAAQIRIRDLATKAKNIGRVKVKTLGIFLGA